MVMTMKRMLVDGRARSSGVVLISGAKNVALSIIAASLLSPSKSDPA
jgi:UDP-N-acetylglucosamine enolpyruvyl transferase